VLVRSERARLHRADGESFLVDPARQLKFKLNATAETITEALAAPIAREDLHARLVDGFDAPRAELAEQADRFLARLDELGYVESFGEHPVAAGLRRRYLDVLKRALVNSLYAEDALRLELAWSGALSGELLADQRLLRDVRYERPRAYRDLIEVKRVGGLARTFGARLSHTMIGLSGLDNLERCAARVFADGIPGDFLEAGVCHGGAAIFLRALQVAYGEDRRCTWVADSFAGVPPPTHPVDREHELDLSEPQQPWMAADLQAVRDNFETYGLLSDRVRFLPGLFAETLPTAPVDQLAILRLDGDLYASTRDTLVAMYDRVAPGGFVIIDDYGALEPCRLAVDEFLAERGLDVELHQVDGTRVCWRKGS
jgi:O-methyltransferase